MTTIHFQNARLIDPEAGTDATGPRTSFLCCSVPNL